MMPTTNDPIEIPTSIALFSDEIISIKHIYLAINEIHNDV